MYIVKPFARFISVLCDFYAKRKITKSRRLPKMDCVFVKARKISKALKSNRGSAVNYSKYLTRELPGIDYTEKGNILASGIEGTTEKPLEFWQKAEDRENQTKRKATARFAKEYIVALPHNLPIDEQSKICKTLAEKLSKGKPFLRVDLYECNEKIYVGELTFFPDSGFDFGGYVLY
jgi:hypothetical protein